MVCVVRDVVRKTFDRPQMKQMLFAALDALKLRKLVPTLLPDFAYFNVMAVGGEVFCVGNPAIGL